MTTFDTDRSTLGGAMSHLESALRTLRGVNRIIVRAKTRIALLHEVCDVLVSCGCLSSWIALFGDDTSITESQASGLSDDFQSMVEYLRRGKLPPCCVEALSSQEVVAVDQRSACGGCSLNSTPCGHGRSMTACLRHEGHVHGLLVVSLPDSRVVNEDERSLLDEVARLVAFTLHTMDEADRRRTMEGQLREAADKYHRVFQTIEDVFYETTLDGTILDISPSIEFISKYTSEELIGTPVQALYTDPSEREHLLAAVMAKGQLRDFQLTLADKDGTTRTTSVSVALMRDENGTPARIVGSLRDISDRVHAEQALRASEDKFSKAFFSAPVLVAISTLEDGRYLDVNDTFVTLTGYSRESAVGATPVELGMTSPGERDQFVERIRADGHVRDLELKLIRADGEPLFCLYSGELLDIAGEQRLLSIAVDISDRKRVLDGLERRVSALTRSMDAEEDVSFEDLFNIEDLQRLQDQFADATSVASIITTPDGRPITKPSRFCRLCSELIRKTEKGLSNCLKSDEVLGRQYANGPNVRACLSGGLWDAGANISVGGRHVANWLIGQVRTETQNEDQILAYAREIGADPEDMLAAFCEVPSMSRDRFEKVAQVLYSLAQQLSTTAYQTVQQARFIENQQQAVEALRESERDLSRAQALAQIGSWKFDLSAGTVIASEETRRIYGVTTDDLVISTIQSIPLAECRADMDRALRALIDEGKPYDMEFRIARKSDGVIRDIRSIAEYDRDKSVLTGTIQDVTVAKSMEEDIRRSERTYRTLLQGLPDIVMRFDRAGRFIFVSDNIRKMIDLASDELIGKSTRELVLPNDLCNLWEKHISAVFRRREPVETEFTLTAASDTMHFNWRVLPELGTDGEVESVLTIARDITETRLMADRMRHMEKMEAIGQLAGGVAHDFNNQLTVIIGYGGILQDELTDPALLQYLGCILNGARRSAELTNQLLAFSRKSDQQSAPVDMHAIIHEVVNILSHSIDKRIQLRQRLEATQHTVMGDGSQIHNAILNLAVNARDAMPNGGELCFATRTVELSNLACAQLPQDIPPGRYLELRVRDTGNGMSGEVKRHIFEPFFTTKDVGKGTGMGLAAVYGTIRQHRGAISCDSQEGKGTCFTCHLPVVIAAATIAEELPTAVADFRGKRILVIDDEDALRRMATHMLRGMGCAAHATADGQEGAEYYRKHWRDIDLVILDLIMPRMDGRETFLALQAANPAVRVLIASGFSARDGAEELLAQGAAGFLKKPFSRRELTEQLARIFEANGG